MFDLLLLFVCLFLFSALLRKKSIVLKICNVVLFVLFLFVVLFTTNNKVIINSVSNWVGVEQYETIRNALTNPKSFSYASNSVWFLYKVFLILSVAFYGIYIASGYMVKIIIPDGYKFIGVRSTYKKEKFINVNKKNNAKRFLCFERFLN
ncbi:MAG TPA: hypothetical protein DCO89_01245 [Clostridiales bacterium]|nr:hypothetical protein [Clostridiales bacterium]